MRIPCDVTVSPLVNTEWWNSHVQYSKFRRQGIDIICASFIHPKPKANVIFLTGLAESFIKYSEVIQFLYERGFNVFTYDHQSQGLSGRWLTESQSVWVHTFEDYVDDFVYFTTTISKDFPNLPIFVLAHSMGGFITAIAMARLPTLINRAVLCAPMLRMKCGMKATDFQMPLPQPLTYWIVAVARYFGLGTMHSLGYFTEKPTDKINLNVYTSCQSQLDKWMSLRMRYPQLIATCVTNDWAYHSLRAQRRFADRYEFVKTNTLILSAETDYLVNNRAMAIFINKAPAAKMFRVPNAYHEILYENDTIREAALKVVYDFFTQKSDNVQGVEPCYPIENYNPVTPIYTVTELLIRGSGVVLSVAGIVAGLAMIFGDKRK